MTIMIRFQRHDRECGIVGITNGRHHFSTKDHQPNWTMDGLDGADAMV